MKDLYHKLLKKIAHYQVEHPYMILLLLVVLTVSIYGGMSKVRTVASLEQMMPEDIEEIKAFHTLRDNGMGQDMVAIVLSIDRNSSDPNGIMDIRDKEVYDYVAYLTELVSDEPDVIEIYSFPELLDFYAGEPITEKNYGNHLSKNKEKLQQYINDDATITMILATTDVSADDPRMNLLASAIKEKVDSAGHPPGIKVSYAGTPITQQRLGELIAKDRTDTRWISTLLVFIITAIIFTSITSAFVPIIVVTLSVTWLYGTMGYVDLPISTLAGGVAAMVIGIGIDFAIHIMNKFKYERKKGMTVKQAVEAAVVDTGTALTATSITTIAAFLAFLSGQMPEMGRFGILMAIGIAYSLFFSIFGLPTLLIIEEKIIYALKKKIHFGIEGEFQLAKRRQSNNNKMKKR